MAGGDTYVDYLVETGASKSLSGNIKPDYKVFGA
jgi:hypothetical protein